MARVLSLRSLRLALNLPSRRLLSSAVILTRLPSPAPPSPTAHFTAVRCYSMLNSSSISESPPTETKEITETKPETNPEPMFPGCDYKHWLVIMHKPGGEGATKQQMIDCYIQTLAKVLDSEDEAKKKIYSICCEKYIGFGCEIDEETSEKLEGLPGVVFVLPDSYVDQEHKDYGGELFVNGEIVKRPPERQRRVDRQPEKHKNKPRRDDRPRNVGRRGNTVKEQV